VSCGRHEMSEATAEVYWRVVEKRREKGREPDVAVCVCCGGPAPVELVAVETGGHIGIAERCKRCRL
jgi:hypothetical protein